MILGAKGIGPSAAEIFNANGVIIYCFLDDDKKLQDQEIDGVSVMGRTDEGSFLEFIGEKAEAFVAVDENSYKQTLIELLKDKCRTVPVNALHPKATWASTSTMGHGNFVNHGAKIGSMAKLGSFCIIHSGAIIEYNAQVGDYVQVGAGSIINSGSKVEDEAFIGSGCVIVSGVKIGKGARVGAGSVVIADVGEGETVFGNPAQKT